MFVNTQRAQLKLILFLHSVVLFFFSFHFIEYFNLEFLGKTQRAQLASPSKRIN
jgi:cytochrome c biogenesis protein CcdA